MASGAITVGDIQAFVQYSRQFSMPLTQVASMMNVFQSGIASFERVIEFLDAEEQSPDATASVNPPPVRGRAEIEREAQAHGGEDGQTKGVYCSNFGASFRHAGAAGFGSQSGDPFLMLRREMEHLFDNVVSGPSQASTAGAATIVAPRMDISEDDKEIKVVAEMPGATPDKLEV